MEALAAGGAEAKRTFSAMMAMKKLRKQASECSTTPLRNTNEVSWPLH
jgi:hypothetical protein